MTVIPVLHNGMIIMTPNTTTTNTTAHLNNDSNHTTPVPNFQMKSYPSVEAFHKTVQSDSDHGNTTTVITAHCGDCGYCSNPHDVQIYDVTKTTLFSTTTTCAKYGLLWGRATAAKCMMDHVDCTFSCIECWVENIMCDLKKCIFTCLWYGLFSQIDGSSSVSSSSNTTTNPLSDAKSLNPCTLCDEKRCGPHFLQCTGANRRRCGILSDIERHNDVCTMVQPAQWWEDTVTVNIQQQYQTFLENQNL